MANISVTYSFSNSTTSDASQVNTNFTDIINGTSDGTKDFSISALTCAGAVTLNGNTTIGNASSDDLTITASLASSIPLKTHNTYDIGSVTTLGLRAIYMASSGSTKTAKIIGQNNTSDIICTLPIYTGTLRHIPTVISSQTTTYAILASDEFIPCSVSGGAFTATLPTAASASGKVYTIKRTDQTLANALTLATTSSQTIDGVTTRKLMTQYEQFTVLSDGSNWHTISHTYPSLTTSYSGSVGYGATAATNITSQTYYWARIGDSVHIRGSIIFNGAANANGNFRIPLPTGLTIDTAKIANSSAEFFGTAHFRTNSSEYSGWVRYDGSGTTYCTIGRWSDAGAATSTWAGNTTAGSNIPSAAAIANNDFLQVNMIIPITNWES